MWGEWGLMLKPSLTRGLVLGKGTLCGVPWQLPRSRDQISKSWIKHWQAVWQAGPLGQIVTVVKTLEQVLK